MRARVQSKQTGMPKVCAAIAHLKGTLKARTGGRQKKYWKGRREATGRPVSGGRVSKYGKEKVENEKEPRQ